jgi:hypothetical protein
MFLRCELSSQVNPKWTTEFLNEYVCVNNVLNIIPPALFYAISEYAFFERACYVSLCFA